MQPEGSLQFSHRSHCDFKMLFETFFEEVNISRKKKSEELFCLGYDVV